MKAALLAGFLVVLMAAPVLATSGGPGDDRIRGTLGADVLDGGPGDDFIRARLGGDTITGGPGADLIRPGGGDDTVDCGRGFDVVVLFGDPVLDGNDAYTDCEAVISRG